MSKTTPILAWHFLATDHRLASYGDNKRTLIYPGTIVRARGEIIPCANGLHASVRAIDALKYAPGFTVCRVECSGVIVRDAAGDKLACSVRRVIWMADIERELYEFACWCAERALRAAKVEDKPGNASWAAIRAKRAWLNGEIDDKEMDAARAAAWAAARDAAGAAAWAAARAAAGAAARAAEVEAQNVELERILLAIGGSDEPTNCKPRRRAKAGVA